MIAGGMAACQPGYSWGQAGLAPVSLELTHADDVRRARLVVAAAFTSGRLRGGSRVLTHGRSRTRAQRPLRTVLELGSGGGNNAWHLKSRFEMVLVEPSAGMRAVSRALNPECEHVDGDMRTVRLAREFDAVFVHDAVCYMTTESDLRMAIETAFLHCRPGGAALFAPDFVRENFRPSTDHGGSDEESSRSEVPGVDVGSRSVGHDVCGRLRLPAPDA